MRLLCTLFGHRWGSLGPIYQQKWTVEMVNGSTIYFRRAFRYRHCRRGDALKTILVPLIWGGAKRGR